MDPMQKAAKEKTFILWIVASVALFCAPSFASSVRDLPAENRVEIFLPEGQNRTVQQAFDTANRVENYDSAWGVASESSVAPLKFRGLTNNALNRTIGPEQHILLRQLFDSKVVTGLSRESIEAASELSRRAILNSATPADQIAVHMERLRQLAEALKNL